MMRISAASRYCPMSMHAPCCKDPLTHRGDGEVPRRPLVELSGAEVTGAWGLEHKHENQAVMDV